jgi:ABC-type nitrate/sulfonate/bicarbonate transport system ATPase subunit
MTSRLQLRDVSKVFSARRGDTVALEGINLTVEPGEFVCIVGASGCGKSTLLSIVAGLTEPTTGSVTLDGEEIDGPGPDRGLVFQSYSLYPWRSVSQNIALGLELEGVSRDEIRRRVDHYLDVMKLEKWADARPRDRAVVGDGAGGVAAGRAVRGAGRAHEVGDAGVLALGLARDGHDGADGHS